MTFIGWRTKEQGIIRSLINEDGDILEVPKEHEAWKVRLYYKIKGKLTPQYQR